MNRRTAVQRNAAVVGAGAAGLAAACLLQRSGIGVKVYEKSRGVGGRAASRSRHGCRYDHGANYFTVDDPEVHEWIFEQLAADDLALIEGEILPFDNRGVVGAPRKSRSGGKRYSFCSGISSLGKAMRDTFALDIVHGTRIRNLSRDDSGWKLEDEEGERYGGFDFVVITAPLPQALELIEASSFDGEMKAELLAAFFDIRYLCQFSVVMNFSGHYALPEGAYALINADRKHAISWVSNEGFKPGHVPDNESLFVVQMAPDWSAERKGAQNEDIAQQAFLEVCDLLGGELPPPQWSDVQWWQYAHPQPGEEVCCPLSASAAGLFFAGDGLVGRGRVARALKSGFAAARAINGNCKDK